jgi:hypothetical protein
MAISVLKLQALPQNQIWKQHLCNLHINGIQSQLGYCACSCPICHDVLEASVSLACGHSFCSKCLESHQRRGSLWCPVDRRPFQPSQISPDLVLRNIIRGLNRRCLYSLVYDFATSSYKLVSILSSAGSYHCEESTHNCSIKYCGICFLHWLSLQTSYHFRSSKSRKLKDRASCNVSPSAI